MRPLIYVSVLAICVGVIVLLPARTPAIQNIDRPVGITTQTIPELLPQNSAELLFTGDIMLGRFVETLAERNPAGYLTSNITDFLHQDDRIIITNFESAMAVPHVHSPNGTFAFSTQVENLVALEELNVQYASLANNHSFDFGQSSYTDAIASLASIGVTAFGHARNLTEDSIVYIESGDYTIGIIGIHTLFNQPTAAELQPLLATMRSQSDLQIAYIHWGNEYELIHAPKQARLATDLVALGIDAVIGHHPHVTQDIQLINGVPVFYSLGNFIFDQYFSADVQEGLLVGLVVQPNSLQFTLYPQTSAGTLSQPRLMESSDREAFLIKLAEHSDTGLSEAIQLGILEIPWQDTDLTE